MSSLRSPSDSARKITSSIKDASNKHIDPRTGVAEQGPSRMGFDSSSQSAYVKECSPVESSSRNAYTNTRSDNHLNHSFKGKKENVINGRNNVSPGSSQHLTYQSNTAKYPVNPIMDSGYGSLDKLKMDGNSQMRSPVLTRRLSNKMAKSNGHSFDSDEGRSEERGSSGFVNTMGMPLSMKDTAYDYIRVKK